MGGILSRLTDITKNRNMVEVVGTAVVVLGIIATVINDILLPALQQLQAVLGG